MTVEERLANLEKGYKELCQAHDRNKQMHLKMKSTCDAMNANIKEMTKLIKGEQLINQQSMKLHQHIMERLQKLEKN